MTLPSENESIDQRRAADLLHLVKGPLAVAVRYADELRHRPLDNESALLAERVYGLLSKTLRSTRLLNLLSSLETKMPSIHARPALTEDFIILVKRCVDETQVAALSGRRRIPIELEIKIELKSDSLALSFDPDLIEQAIFCLLDNAVKYSHPDRPIHVRVACAIAHVIMEVTTSGLVVTPGDAAQALKRGWRGAQAQMITEDGSGIGLYLADAIAKSHMGEVILYPTDSHNRTIASLKLPTLKIATES